MTGPISSDHFAESIRRLEERTADELLSQQYSILDSRPLFDVELSAFCNLNCTMCPRDKMGRKMGVMDLDTIEKLTEWVPARTNVMISGIGEPLLNPNIFACVAGLKENGTTVGITTNGALLDKHIVERLVSAGIDMIQVSIQSIDQNLYETMMRGGDFRLVRRNLDYLSELKSNGLILQLTTVKQDENEDEICRIEEFARSHGFTFHLRNIHSRGGYLEIEGWNDGESPKIIGCGMFPKIGFIAWDGSILACCQDLDGKTRLGNLDSVSFGRLKEKKREVIGEGRWYGICSYCNDEYRYLLLENPTMIDQEDTTR